MGIEEERAGWGERAKAFFIQFWFLNTGNVFKTMQEESHKKWNENNMAIMKWFLNPIKFLWLLATGVATVSANVVK